MEPGVVGSSPTGGTIFPAVYRVDIGRYFGAIVELAVPGARPGGVTILAASDAPENFASPHARYAAHTARKLGLSFRSLDGADGYLFEIGDGERRANFCAGAGTPYALNHAHAAAIARDKWFSQTVLAEAGIATIPSRLFFVTEEHVALRSPGREPSDARAFAAIADYPIFCKPILGAQGAFAEIIADEAEFVRYLARVSKSHYAILAQPVIDAPEYRVAVLHGRALFCYEKRRPTLLGDGVSTLAQLVKASELPLSETARARDISGQLYRGSDKPPRGATLRLEGPANRAVGGGASAPSTDVPAPLAAIALAAAHAIDLGFAAIDLFETRNGLVVIEVNASPAVKTLEEHGRLDLIETIWTANIEAALRSAT